MPLHIEMPLHMQSTYTTCFILIQVCYKPEELPAAESDSAQPIFGIHDATEAKLRESRRRAQDIFHDQLCAENQKTEEALKRHRQDRQEDQKMLERTKRE